MCSQIYSSPQSMACVSWHCSEHHKLHCVQDIYRLYHSVGHACAEGEEDLKGRCRGRELRLKGQVHAGAAVKGLDSIFILCFTTQSTLQKKLRPPKHSHRTIRSTFPITPSTRYRLAVMAPDKPPAFWLVAGPLYHMQVAPTLVWIWNIWIIWMVPDSTNTGPN